MLIIYKESRLINDTEGGELRIYYNKESRVQKSVGTIKNNNNDKTLGIEGN